MWYLLLLLTTTHAAMLTPRCEEIVKEATEVAANGYHLLRRISEADSGVVILSETAEWLGEFQYPDRPVLAREITRSCRDESQIEIAKRDRLRNDYRALLQRRAWLYRFANRCAGYNHKEGQFHQNPPTWRVVQPPPPPPRVRYISPKQQMVVVLSIVMVFATVLILFHGYLRRFNDIKPIGSATCIPLTALTTVLLFGDDGFDEYQIFDLFRLGASLGSVVAFFTMYMLVVRYYPQPALQPLPRPPVPRVINIPAALPPPARATGSS